MNTDEKLDLLIAEMHDMKKDISDLKTQNFKIQHKLDKIEENQKKHEIDILRMKADMIENFQELNYKTEQNTQSIDSIFNKLIAEEIITVK